ncbi:MFS gliotoxin efflux transporter glia [Xylaria palmicola]|nr:MFS gliotoxin efflux transporter glia [Xylaria palmicola]
MTDQASLSKDEADTTPKTTQWALGEDTPGKDGPTTQEKNLDISYPTGPVLIIIVSGLLLSLFLVALDVSIISTAIPKITSEFNSMPDVGWYGSAFFLALASFQSIWGKAYKYYSLKLVFMASVVVFEIGSLVAALSRNSETLIVGRALQGAGGSGITGGCYNIAAFIVPPERVNIIIGLLGAVFSLSSVVGPLLGGAFTQRLTWHWCFWINLPVGGAALFCLLFFRTPERSRSKVRLGFVEAIYNFDPIGLIIIIASLVTFFLALQWGGISKPWSSGTVIAVLVVWIVLTIGWIVLQWFQKDRALLSTRMLSNRHIAACCIYLFFLSSANFSLVYNIPIYFQAVKGQSPLQSGILTIPTILSTSLASFASSAFVGKAGLYSPFLLVGGVLSTVGAGLIYTWDLNTTIGKIVGYQIIYGVGTGISVQIPLIVGSVVVPGADHSIATATILFFNFVSAAYGVGATGSILNNLLLEALPTYLPSKDPHEVLSIGSSALQKFLQGEQLQGARHAYIRGLRGSWALAIALFGVASLAALLPKSWGQLVPPSDHSDEKVQDREFSGSGDILTSSQA